MTNITGQHDAGGTLVLRRSFNAPIDDVWSSIADSDRLARWFGTWTGDPASGSVMVTMNAEADELPPVEYQILQCDPPRVLTVRASGMFGTWWLTAELAERCGPAAEPVRPPSRAARVSAAGQEPMVRARRG